MTMNNNPATTVTLPSDLEIVVTRIFDAPRELLWKVWTQPEHLVHWFGSEDWMLVECEIDLRPGGIWKYCMQGPTGGKSWGLAVYHEVVEPERLVYTDYFADAEGNPVEGMPEALVTVKFSKNQGKTTYTSASRYRTTEERDRVLRMGLEKGLRAALERVERYLASLLPLSK